MEYVIVWDPSRHNLILLKPDYKVTNSHRTNVRNIFPFKSSSKSWAEKTIFHKSINFVIPNDIRQSSEYYTRNNSFLPTNYLWNIKTMKPHTQRKLNSCQNSFLLNEILNYVSSISLLKSVKIRNTIQSLHFYFIFNITSLIQDCKNPKFKQFSILHAK